MVRCALLPQHKPQDKPTNHRNQTTEDAEETKCLIGVPLLHAVLPPRLFDQISTQAVDKGLGWFYRQHDGYKNPFHRLPFARRDIVLQNDVSLTRSPEHP
jgi:hypothetical protein